MLIALTAASFNKGTAFDGGAGDEIVHESGAIWRRSVSSHSLLSRSVRYITQTRYRNSSKFSRINVVVASTRAGSAGLLPP